VVNLHEPVMVRPVLDLFVHRLDGVYLDGTAGTGGHAEAILQRLSPLGRLICLDQDPDVLVVARERLAPFGDRCRFHRGSFSETGDFLAAESLTAVDGILLDLGLNAWSLVQPGKGLSYLMDGPLRMNVDPDLPRSAAEVIGRASEAEMVRVFTEYGGVRRPRVYARRVVAARGKQTIRTTYELVRAFTGSTPGDPGPAELSRLFQALRVEVGREADRLERFLGRAPGWVSPGGRLAILSYASHEDRRVKEWSRRWRDDPDGFVPLHKGVIRPDAEEVLRNRKARSARLRVFERKGGA
jgi:16S rRNA (cytosine1402-N4)-methyltransferase